VLSRWLIYHVASGHAFFTGVACLIAAALVSWFDRRRGVQAGRNLLVAVCGAAVAASATPLAVWAYLLLALATLVWLTAEAFRKRESSRFVAGVRVVVVLAWSAAALVEAPFHRTPRLSAMRRPALGIIGDSLTAGMGGDGATTWPKLLADRRGVEVRDHARMGATVASALRQADELAPDERLVLLEIGGNDLLGGTPPRDFETGLDQLLSAVRRFGRVVVMLELPLPPTYNAFGIIQRRLAHRHRIPLVPKRILLGVLEQEGATLDSIHLSPEGHRHMAKAVWVILRTAYTDQERGSGRTTGHPQAPAPPSGSRSVPSPPRESVWPKDISWLCRTRRPTLPG